MPHTETTNPALAFLERQQTLRVLDAIDTYQDLVDCSKQSLSIDGTTLCTFKRSNNEYARLTPHQINEQMIDIFVAADRSEEVKQQIQNRINSIKQQIPLNSPKS
jgi:hypothetical protein